MSKFNKIIFGLIVIFIIVIIIVIAGFLALNRIPEKACTLEAKICPDGSAVGRTGPNCEFASCPTFTPTPFCEDLCGDGICQEVVCMAIGCPCPETPETCPRDCK